jgi:2-succinyl-5-enolpyruvyl-6-hydroxy-3-cyclohexene-1-carboxylate synthase
MKIKINRNILWAETFVKELASLGVKYASISPGSRNTPLTLAFAGNKNIKTYVNIDERSSAFFALGLAKATATPVAVVVTSGTATAELYPAIIEAYQQRIPLIICTADRPPELINKGANQTINQNNIYKNHIRWFKNVGLPEPTIKKLKALKQDAIDSVIISTIKSRGPVHLNFPFKKPFEPKFTTDSVNEKIISFSTTNSTLRSSSSVKNLPDKNSIKFIDRIFNLVKEKEKGLIIVGPDDYDSKFLKNCQILSAKLNYPILADGASQLRFGKHDKKNVITNFDAILRSENFTQKNHPEVIIQFGRTITSKGLDAFLDKCNAARFMINEYGDWFDPSDKSIASIACKPYLFCYELIKRIDKEIVIRNSTAWFSNFIDAEIISNNLKKNIIEKSSFPNECRLVTEIINNVPENCRIMLSNSMPIRDFDYFAQNNNKNIVVFNNRGASGIDGITSTALGIAEASKKASLLITGDLAFYYDMNGLLAAMRYKIPLVVVLINNNGGGIFEILPISEYGNVFKKYFVSPHSLDFSTFIKGYGGHYIKVKSWKHFNFALKEAFGLKNFTVLELKTKSSNSLKLRKKFWKEVSKSLK